MSIVLVLLFRLYDITRVFEAHFSPLRVGVRGRRTHARQSKGKANRVLDDIFGKYYDVHNTRIRYPKTSNERKLLTTLNDLYEIRVKLGKYRDEKGNMKYKMGISDEMHIAQLERVLKLHRTAIKLNSLLQTISNRSDTIITIQKSKLDEINDMIIGFNEYMTQNQLVKFRYNEMSVIVLPEDIIVYDRVKKNDSYQVNIETSLLDSTGVEDLEIKLKDSASITPTLNIYDEPIYNKRIEKHNEDIKNKDKWCCKKCGFGHMLFEVI